MRVENKTMNTELLSRRGPLLAPIVVSAFLAPGGFAMAYEEPDYSVVQVTDDYEIRRYNSFIVAETDVAGDFDDAGSAAFRILAGYIFGANRRPGIALGSDAGARENVKMAMTVPVISEASDASSERGFTYGFVMPSEFSLESLPVPLNPQVRIRSVPERLVAVLKYSGRWTEKSYREHESELLRALERDGVETEGAPQFARYNGPWAPWFMRRNEVMIGVAAPVS
jgi:hypothetical protein